MDSNEAESLPQFVEITHHQPFCKNVEIFDEEARCKTISHDGQIWERSWCENLPLQVSDHVESVICGRIDSN